MNLDVWKERISKSIFIKLLEQNLFVLRSTISQSGFHIKLKQMYVLLLQVLFKDRLGVLFIVFKE